VRRSYVGQRIDHRPSPRSPSSNCWACDARLPRSLSSGQSDELVDELLKQLREQMLADAPPRDRNDDDEDEDEDEHGEEEDKEPPVVCEPDQD
jgi:hypothetical protein